MQEETHHVVLWGALRFLLGLAQITLAPFGMYTVLALGLDHWLTRALVGSATGAAITSRILEQFPIG